MGLWFRIRLGPFGYTIRSRRRRRPQSYRAYKAARQRREAYAARYKQEQSQARARVQRASRESEWLDRVVAFEDELIARLDTYGAACVAGGSRDHAIAQLTAAPAAFDSMVGATAPTKRTREIEGLVRQLAEKSALRVQLWERYLATLDQSDKDRADAAHRDFIDLASRGQQLIEVLKRG